VDGFLIRGAWPWWILLAVGVLTAALSLRVALRTRRDRWAILNDAYGGVSTSLFAAAFLVPSTTVAVVILAIMGALSVALMLKLVRSQMMK
jgi:hypothetical protein